MKFIILLLLASEPFYFPFDTTLDCYDQGMEIMESIATYHGPGSNQGWYTDHGTLIYGFYCE
jgi:hypothetical protein